MTRVYVPASRSSLARLHEDGTLGPAPLVAHAVTDAVRVAWPDADEEELEYAAMTAAAQHSVALLDDDEPARRVVVAVDVDDVAPVPGEDPTAVTVPGAVWRRQVASVHVDSADAEPSVAAARAAHGTAAYDGALEACLDHELGWYATQELGDLLDR